MSDENTARLLSVLEGKTVSVDDIQRVVKEGLYSVSKTVDYTLSNNRGYTYATRTGWVTVTITKRYKFAGETLTHTYFDESIQDAPR